MESGCERPVSPPVESSKSVCISSLSIYANPKCLRNQSQPEKRKPKRDSRRSRARKKIEGFRKFNQGQRQGPHLECCYAPKMDVLMGLRCEAKLRTRTIEVRGFIFDVNGNSGSVLCPVNLANPRVHIFFDERTEINFAEASGSVETDREKILVPGTDVDVTIAVARDLLSNDPEFHRIVVCEQMVVHPVLKEAKEKGAVMVNGRIVRRTKRNHFRPISITSGPTNGTIENVFAEDEFGNSVLVYSQIYRSKKVLDALAENELSVRIPIDEFLNPEYMESIRTERTHEGFIVKAPDWVKNCSAAHLFVQGIAVALRPYGEHFEGFATLSTYHPTEMTLEPHHQLIASKIGTILVQKNDLPTYQRKSRDNGADPSQQEGAIYRFRACKELPGVEKTTRIYGIEYVAPPGSEGYEKSESSEVDPIVEEETALAKEVSENGAEGNDKVTGDFGSDAESPEAEEGAKKENAQETFLKRKLRFGSAPHDVAFERGRQYFKDLLEQYEANLYEY
ncbi:hypothetical protein L596_008541 [Steinernema carpocapsae]|uniref:Uncharacterized protein n=1 Tax=Steinernema carpocapsae TaxID=34508 RepID=A0A4U5PCT5_STECR|nr:hypothetical protein L596_008541 [Steinernema carpocapsae]